VLHCSFPYANGCFSLKGFLYPWTSTRFSEKGPRNISIGIDVISAPEPHPLDFDWRFDAQSVDKLAQIVPTTTPIMALGCPSLAKRFRELGIEAMLVDRQPIQGAEGQIELDIQTDPPRKFNSLTAIIDPPWYPGHLFRWVSWAAACVGEGGEVYASIWPPGTRPTGEIEYLEARKWMDTWATVSELKYRPTYNIPTFELASLQSSEAGALAQSPRVGRLLRIKVNEVPPLPSISPSGECWRRFVFNDYQIAIRKSAEEPNSPAINQLSNADGWIWPYVSRRAPHRDKIDIWSSRNEVAQATGVRTLTDAFRALSASQSTTDFEYLISQFPFLTEWKLPCPPYWRTREWLHLQ
jgi:hypothetical protein